MTTAPSNITDGSLPYPRRILCSEVKVGDIVELVEPSIGPGAIVGLVIAQLNADGLLHIRTRDDVDHTIRCIAGGTILVKWRWVKEPAAAPQYTPTSPRALALELHRTRGHKASEKRILRWLCDCCHDAVVITKTQWAKDIRKLGA